MKRLNEQQKSIIKRLAKSGMSINKICKKLNLPKSTVYYWFRKTIGRKIKKVTIKNNLEEEIGEIIGIFAGDGNFYMDKNYRYRVRFYFSNDEIRYAQKVNWLLKQVYGKYGRVFTQGNMILIQIISKDISNHIKKFLFWEGKKTYSVRLKKQPKYYSLDFLKGFCRGLMDSDGWSTKGNLMISCVSEKLMNNLSESLTICGVPHLKTKWKRKDEVKSQTAIFLKKERAIKYSKIIGTSNSKKKIMPLAGISG